MTAREALAALAALVEQLPRRAPPPERGRTEALAFSTFTPWWAQRLAGRSPARTIVVVAGRQAGKTLWAAFAVLRRAFELPGSYSAVLAPTYLKAETAILRMRQVAVGLKVRWKENGKRFVLPNGSVIQVFSADRKDEVRGPTITASYWIDEAAYVHEEAYESGNPAKITARPTTIVTTTPVGKNWVHREFTRDDEVPGSTTRTTSRTARFRFRSEDSPYSDKEEIADQRRRMTPERAAQEFDAQFVDDILLAFPNVSRLFVESLPDRRREEDLRHVLGVDLGKEQDWCVATLMNRYGEARILGRWRRVGWPQTQLEIEGMAKAFGAMIVMDLGVSGGPGGVLKDFLEERGHAVLGVNTAVLGLKAQLVEQARSNVQWEQIKVIDNEFSNQLRHELKLFQGTRRIVQGKEVMNYEGPQLKDEHDDCVVSLCLANWGRLKGWSGGEPEADDLVAFVEGNLRMAAALERGRVSVPLGDGRVYRLPSQTPPEVRPWVS